MTTLKNIEKLRKSSSDWPWTSETSWLPPANFLFEGQLMFCKPWNLYRSFWINLICFRYSLPCKPRHDNVAAGANRALHQRMDTSYPDKHAGGLWVCIHKQTFKVQFRKNKCKIYSNRLNSKISVCRTKFWIVPNTFWMLWAPLSIPATLALFPTDRQFKYFSLQIHRYTFLFCLFPWHKNSTCSKMNQKSWKIL